MRIQNNIMAMNTHRMYTTNNANIQKSAEKLSSGYRINRAGDDAAGLAISEKMRSQIRGLNMASKNSQDAISLVQTAEGALQEVHSMLQRMNELAVQSATGTNQEFDRLQLAKEFDQLKREINDISEQTTFNNMKILDGSLSSQGPERSAETAGFYATEVTEPDDSALTVLTKTAGVAEKDAVDAKAASFEIDLTGLAGGGSDTITEITIGSDPFSFATAITADADATAGSIASAIAADSSISSGVTIDGVGYTVKAEGNKLVFTEKDPPASVEGTISTPPSTVAFTQSAAATLTAASFDWDIGSLSVSSDGGGKITGINIGGTTYSFGELTLEDSATGASIAEAIVDKFANQELDIGGNKFTVGHDDSGKLTFTAVEAGEGVALADLPTTSTSISIITDDAVFTGTTVAVNASNSLAGEGDATGALNGMENVKFDNVKPGVAAAAAEPAVAASTDFEIDLLTAKAGDSLTIGSTKLTFVAEGSEITDPKTQIELKEGMTEADLAAALDTALDGKYDVEVSGTTFTATQAPGTETTGNVNVSYKAADTVTQTQLEFDVTKMRDGDILKFDIEGEKVEFIWGKDAGGDSIADIFEAISGSTTFADGEIKHQGSTITVKKDVKIDFEPVTPDVADYGTMRIQVGALENEQLNIEVKSMNTAGLKLDGFNLETQDSAGEAITATRAAVNIVSEQRALLGAMQNRLEHKISNLDNTAENLQAAEARIRDVDIAKEMTNFTKNNILAQAATAMLAQANAAPQSVLSLLQ